MTKFIFFLIFLGAAPSLAQSLIIERSNNLGISAVDIIEKKNNIYYVTGKKIGKQLPVKIEKTWNHVSRAPASLERASQNMSCSSGRFKIVVKNSKNKIEETFKGCAQGSAYGKFLSDIYELREYARSL